MEEPADQSPRSDPIVPAEFDGLFNLCAKVSFETDEGRFIVILVKYNRKTVNVLSEEGCQWRVTPGHLSAVEDIDTPPTVPRRNNSDKSGRGNSGLQ
ncbi:MAG: hypothetical protein JAZ20_14540 [Candidatus Thiodiazotropha weberae]|nr:hypothetical protein [Candidatus Thiodiazotropha lotti]MCG8011908.1 hypothetical protein [Candidatus Thiodiazotropha lotti]MCG8021625.1 hypothetical protein [Candidatus Thiodiazotropha lotti]MCW4208794.1 hypothetical protein [Candidatus Thiodiazotropha lotti]MCW4211375.1 hypothetical protein [Candidatus Thiodiazotropha lotti]